MSRVIFAAVYPARDAAARLSPKVAVSRSGLIKVGNQRYDGRANSFFFKCNLQLRWGDTVSVLNESPVFYGGIEGREEGWI